MKKLVIVPAYNEMGSIANTIKDIKTYAEGFDYVIINDCSTDATEQICREHQFNTVNLPVNLGIGGAVQTGYLYALKNNYDIAVQFDGDGQHDAAYLGKMAEYLQEQDVDMVIGSRFLEKQGFQSSGMRRIGIKYFTFLIKLMSGVKITDPTSGMRMVNRKVIESYVKYYPKDYPEPESVVVILMEGKQVREMPVIMRERAEGISSISPLKSFYYMFKVTLAVIFARMRK